MVAFIYVVLIWMLVYQFMGASRPEDTWSFLTKQRGGLATDSSILLPMSCFLDPDLDPLQRLTDAQLNRVGGVLGTKAATLEVIVGSAMLVCFLLSHLAHGIRWCRGHSRPKANRPAWWGVIVSLYWIVALGASTVAYVACYLIVWCLRGWVYESGWMEDNGNSERDVSGIGQILPIIALCWVLIWSLDWSTPSTSSTGLTGKNGNSGQGHPGGTV